MKRDISTENFVTENFGSAALLFDFRMIVSGASSYQLPQPKASGQIPDMLGAEDAYEFGTPEEGSQKDISGSGKSILFIHVIDV
jgi:hypothetical protein